MAEHVLVLPRTLSISTAYRSTAEIPNKLNRDRKQVYVYAVRHPHVYLLVVQRQREEGGCGMCTSGVAS